MAENLGAQELAHMMALHGDNPADRFVNTAAVWDARVESWAKANWQENLAWGAAMARVKDTAAYLRGQGLLGPEADVIDIGCGPGRFVTEFARTARSAMGIDISPRTIDYARRFAKEAGQQNTAFLAADFQALDLAAAGLEGAFDLAFSAITPAIRGMAGLEKFMALSRAWCYVSNFVQSRDALYERIGREVFGRPVYKQWEGKHFYTTFNILFLLGYQPVTGYYTQVKESRRQVSQEAANACAEAVLPPTEQTEANIRKIYDWLGAHADGEGGIREQSRFLYGWLLWDQRLRGESRRFDWI